MIRYTSKTVKFKEYVTEPDGKTYKVSTIECNFDYRGDEMHFKSMTNQRLECQDKQTYLINQSLSKLSKKMEVGKANLPQNTNQLHQTIK